jgi:signal transduction histidine kinase
MALLLAGAAAPATTHPAVQGERERLAADLHDGASQLFVAIGLLARRQAETLPAGSEERTWALRVAQLADQGSREIDQAIRGLTAAPTTHRELAEALVALGDSISFDSGIAVCVRVEGQREDVRPEVHQALYRVAHQALINAWRHADCGRIDVTVAAGPNGTALRVADDGRGVSADRAPTGRLHMGVAGMHRTVAEVGGTVAIAPGEDGGLVVEAAIETAC